MYKVQELTMFLWGMKKNYCAEKRKDREKRIEETHKEYAKIWKIKKLKVTKNREIIKKYMKEKHTMFVFAPL